ncbi:Rieske 2Fe-2S domain-containing protein [Nocardia amamiensis]|uniref:Rieske 2Fe-2S domain-containing protein n=1 Tax=Nocardia amamiensis TaxID=404578 RepID=A0ABS0CXQ5_9NOCA|nr:DUF5914 domain-containing protein [Nocardia amamiensis]MBF6301381.1 Rieske 2Fe-2S domain-containing protein [Nocardia amamiensis]
MKAIRAIPAHWWKTSPLRPIAPQVWSEQRPTYGQARPQLIEAALRSASQRPSGNWFVLAASRDITAKRPFGTTVAGVEIVAWRDTRGLLHAGPGACPHLGADLATARVHDGALLCRWHGLRIDGRCTPRWAPFPAHDDGVLTWVRLDTIGREQPTDTPILTARPADTRVHAVITLTGICEPADIIANRLDPWHGSWFHPYSFAHLDVTRTPRQDDDRFLVTVTFRVTRHLGVPVEAEFTCPDPRTIVMRILSGEGAGSIVETHATPAGIDGDGRARTTVVEAIIADSARPGFRHAPRTLPLLRPLMRRAAQRLWRDDFSYAERRYHLRTQGNRTPVHPNRTPRTNEVC